MKNYRYIITVVASLIGTLSFVQAREHIGTTSGKRGAGNSANVAANCSQPSSRTFLEVNNVRALIHTGGDMWWDLVGRASYEVPSGSGTNSLFAGSLWIGGEDISGQLKLAALRFRSNGTDFWTGPLSTVDAEIGPDVCAEYDNHYATTRIEVSTFRQWYRCNLDPDCDSQEEFPGYQVPQSIIDWPAHGDDADPFNQDFYLAPFEDVDDNKEYNPLDGGDYPRYDLDGTTDCGQKIVDIYGDENLWWVFNDKGNIHTETGGEAIGMEIRAQAFGFSTNDEVNNMTFYNYELHNRSSFQLTNTYFGFFVDPDIGNAQDDYVGCDVSRGLGYAFNGREIDESAGGAVGYGENPPAIGVDFFQGPFQDSDGKDNCLCLDDYAGAIADDGVPYAGLGVGYGDGVVDNERMGMRAFLYFTNNNDNRVGDPSIAPEYYNLLRSIWKDNSDMLYGGQGIQGDFDSPEQRALYMFPGDSDPIGWGTEGNPRNPWTEVTADNEPQDRRFVQSSGPFVLAPGAVNNITVGVVWSRANSGGASASVNKLLIDDQKTQALFDACFQLLDGPDAPQLDVVELDREIILTIDNPSSSNNVNESYEEIDPFIVVLEEDSNLTPEEELAYKTYKFQGYQVFQLADESVSASDIYDDTKARLIFQTDVKDSITNLTNYVFDQEVQAEVALPRVTNADNDGIRKTIRITQDLFAQGDRSLVNHKTYYFMAIAYAHNNYKTYRQNSPGNLDGQKTPYLPSRRSVTGAIPVTSAIPHISSVRDNGTIINSVYGTTIPVTKLEGVGNSGLNLDISDSTASAMFTTGANKLERIDYMAGATPIEIKVIDPLSVKKGTYAVYFRDSTSTSGNINNSYWEIIDIADDTTLASSSSAISVGSEDVISDLGISIRILQIAYPGEVEADANGIINSSVEFKDNSKPWLTGFADDDGNAFLNWIRSGTSTNSDNEELSDYDPEENKGWIDEQEHYEAVLGGTWAPFRMMSAYTHGPSTNITLPAGGSLTHEAIFTAFPNYAPTGDNAYILRWLRNVNIVITDDKEKWTRSAVIEAQDDPNLAVGNGSKMMLRTSPSVDKDGLPYDTANGLTPSTNPNDPNYIGATGMGWFPGYAIDIETGERLNIAFAEDSYLLSENGNDMIWNPTSTETSGPAEIDIRYGGKHFIYVFRNNILEENELISPRTYNEPENRMPAYDNGQFIYDKLTSGTRNDVSSVWRACSWTGFPRLVVGQELLSTDVTVKLRVNSPYKRYSTSNEYLSIGEELKAGTSYLVESGPVVAEGVTYERGEVITPTSDVVLLSDPNTGTDVKNNVAATINGGLPVYEFSLDGLEPQTNVQSVAEDALDIINVVPNPYYAYSTYEADKIDNRVKIVNLPTRANIKIYTINGILVREFKKDDPNITSIDWDLKNHARIPIASGVYLIHVDVPGVGEQVIKWFAVMRPVDLDSF